MSEDRRRRHRQANLGVVRAFLLTLWCFVLWGTLIALGALWSALTSGPSTALKELAQLSPFNLALGTVAIVIWILVAWAAAAGRTDEN